MIEVKPDTESEKEMGLYREVADLIIKKVKGRPLNDEVIHFVSMITERYFHKKFDIPIEGIVIESSFDSIVLGNFIIDPEDLDKFNMWRKNG